MKCSELKLSFSSYLDDGLESRSAIDGIERHLATCPLCRQELDNLRQVRNGLRSMSRPEMPGSVLMALRKTVQNELDASQQRPGLFLPAWRTASYQVWVMSYSVGAFATLLFGFSFLWMIIASAPRADRSNYITGSSSSVLLTDERSSHRITPMEFVQTRSDVAAESPSVNPRGTLIELTEALVNGELRDDEVVVVADVYENGLAQVTEVVEPSRDRRAVGELVRAFETDPASSPFVPATMDQRSDIVRVVLKIQSVDVNINEPPRRRGRMSL